MAPIDAIRLSLVLTENFPTIPWLPTTPTHYPYVSACGISYASEKVSNMVDNSAEYVVHRYIQYN